jgi:hypothetical protein
MKYILEIRFNEPDNKSTANEEISHIAMLTMCKEFIAAMVSVVGDNVTLYVEDSDDYFEIVRRKRYVKK